MTAGFTLINGPNGKRYHRPSTVLIKDTRKNGKSYILGQDEDTYFGCELPTHPRNVEGALKSLAPKSIRNKLDTIKRQGEWYVVPVNKNQVPKIENCIVTSSDEIALPIMDADSNRHMIDSRDIRVDKNGNIFAHNGSIVHDQHVDIKYTGWHKFIQNTALRSFSEEGVD